MQSRAELVALLTLTTLPNKKSTWGEIASEVSLAGSATTVLIRETEGDSLFQNNYDSEVARATAVVEEWLQHGYNIVTVLDDHYPARLREIREMPPFLFYEGALNSYDRGMSVVGSRRASAQGTAFAEIAAQSLVERGISVIAGLAQGIDTTAHETTLSLGGRTVAVIGTGIDRYYPANNRSLQTSISNKGLVISQFVPGSSPTKFSFPMRNAVMSGYGLATIVAEASETSGTRIQARVAVQHGRPVILSNLVATQTKWGASLLNRPNVYLANNTSDLKRLIDQLDGEDRQLRTWEDTIFNTFGL